MIIDYVVRRFLTTQYDNDKNDDVLLKVQKVGVKTKVSSTVKVVQIPCH